MLAGTLLSALAALAATAHAHTLFTTLSINGMDQGDGTCVRMPKTPSNATFPVEDLASADMVCGQDGLAPVAFTCPVPATKAGKKTGATLSFAFRAVPNDPDAGSIDASHKGPCAVYMKQLPAHALSSAETSPSSGWFKVFEEGYDAATGQWCTEKIAAANGLLTVTLPAGLPGGASYLVRPELLALHRAIEGDPQFYIGCAQVYLEPTDAEAAAMRQNKHASATLDIPEQYAATIPGHVRAGDPSVSYNIYEGSPPSSPYTMPGPGVFVPSAANIKTVKSAAAAADAATDNSASNNLLAAGVELVPSTSTCLVKNANWCGTEVASYSTEAGCWDASADCFQQEQACYDAAPPTGHANCAAWDEQKCSVIQAACMAGNFVGPPNKGQALVSV